MSDELEKKVLELPALAGVLEVKDGRTLEAANCFLQTVKALRAQVDDTFDPIIKAAHEAHKRALSQKKKFELPLAEAERLAKLRIGAYLTEQDRIRRDAEEKARRAEEERARLEREALARAIELEARGRAQEAEAVLAEAAEDELTAPAASAVPERPRAGGLGSREVWRFQIVDPAQVPREFLTPDLVKIGKYVQATKALALIPGVRVWSEKVVTVRSAYGQP